MKHILDPRICSFLDEPRGDRRAMPIFPAGNCETKPFDGNHEPYLVCACGLHGDPPQFYSATQCRECREKEMKKCFPSTITGTQSQKASTSDALGTAPGNCSSTQPSRPDSGTSPSSPKESNVGKLMKLSDMPVGTLVRFSDDTGDLDTGLIIRRPSNDCVHTRTPRGREFPNTRSHGIFEVLADPVIEVGDLVGTPEGTPWVMTQQFMGQLGLMPRLTIIEKGRNRNPQPQGGSL